MHRAICSSSIIAILASMLLLIACGSEEQGPKNVKLELAIQDGKLNVDSGIIRVYQDDNVTFRITSDQAGGFHLHGYNFVVDVEPDQTREMKFEADATGRFIIKLHPFGTDHAEHQVSMKSDDAMGDHESEKQHDDDGAQHSGDEHEESIGHEEEEIMLAYLEVLPR